jgi:hypothetical protein
VAALTVLVAGLHVWLDPRPPEGWWGAVGALSVRGWPRLALFALPVLALFPGVARALFRRTSGLVGGLTRLKLPFALWLMAWVALAWSLREQVLYGDGPQTVELLPKGDWINLKEPLDRALTYVVYRLVSVVFAADARQAIALVSLAAGVAYLFAVRRVARFMELRGSSWRVAAALLLTAGYVQLFFGHVENYSLLAAGALWTLVLALEAVTDRTRRLWPLGLAYGLTVCTHLSAVWLLPAGVVVLVHRWRDNRSPRELVQLVLAGLVPALLTLGLLLARYGGLAGFKLSYFGGGDGRLFVPLGEPETVFEAFSMLSGAHFKAFLNQHLLVAAAALAGLPFLVGAGLGRASQVLGAATVGALAYAFLFNPDMWVVNPQFGMLNEWDLFSLSGVPLTLWVALAVPSAPDARGPEVRPALVVLSLVHGLSWILFNAMVQV